MDNPSKTKQFFINLLLQIGEMTQLFKMTVHGSFTRPFYLNRVIDQIYSLGVGSLSITVFIGLVMGLVMTLNFGHGLAKFGGVLYVPAVVSLSIVREMAPIFTSLIIAGRIGSGMAAELGAMNVTQQIDALRALGSSPVRVLVVPRMIATLISMPFLTAISGMLGILGGLIVCQSEFQMPSGLYFNKVFEAVKMHDFLSGLIKSCFFGLIICLTACYKGFRTTGGTRGVGKATTWVVVVSSISILISDFFLSKVFLVLWTK